MGSLLGRPARDRASAPHRVGCETAGGAQSAETTSTPSAMARNGPAACARRSPRAPDSGSHSGSRADPPWACARAAPVWAAMARCAPIPHRSDHSDNAVAQTPPVAYGALSSTSTLCGAKAALIRAHAIFSNGLLPRLWPLRSVAERIGNAFLERWSEFLHLA